MKEIYIPLPKPPFNYERPLSWSAISSFHWSKEQWYVKYCVHGECKREGEIKNKKGKVIGIVEAFCTVTQCFNAQCPVIATSPEMIFGKNVGERLASDPKYLPEIPRLDTPEHELRVTFEGIPLVGYMDFFCSVTQRKMREDKTGRKKWDKKRVDEHGQIDMYLFMHWIETKIKPEEVECHLDWMPTHIKDGEVAFIEPFQPVHFKTKRTLAQILGHDGFANKIRNTRKDMIEYHKNHR